MKLLALPIVGDYADKRARTRAEPTEWSSALGPLIVAILGALAPAVPVTTSLLEQLPFGPVIIRTVLALLTFALAVFVLVSRRTVAGTAIDPPSREYRNKQPSRTVAKVLVPPLLALSIYRIYEVLPNKLMGRTTSEGFVCNASSNAPVAGATVTLRSGTGASIGEAVTGTDGFVIIDLDAWALRPLTLDIAGPGCSGSSSLRDGSHGTKCAAAGDITSRDDSVLWRVACK